MRGADVSSELYDPIRTMSKVTREVIVSFSTGKDSCVTLDLCQRFFDRVVPFYMYYVPGLSFHERALRWYEKRYNVEIIRLPHFELGTLMRYGMYRTPDYDIPVLSVKDIYNYVRNLTGIEWVCAGERIADSIVRRAMIKHSSPIDVKRGRFYPIAYWKKKEITEYIRVKKLYLAEDSRKLGHSFADFGGVGLSEIKKIWPRDYEQIKKLFPLCDMAVKRYEAYGKK